MNTVLSPRAPAGKSQSNRDEAPDEVKLPPIWKRRRPTYPEGSREAIVLTQGRGILLFSEKTADKVVAGSLAPHEEHRLF